MAKKEKLICESCCRVRVELRGTDGLEYVYDVEPGATMYSTELEEKAKADWVKKGISGAMKTAKNTSPADCWIDVSNLSTDLNQGAGERVDLMDEEKRQTGRTTGLLLEALGKAIQHPSPGYSVFVDHEGGAHNWTALRAVVPKLKKIIEQLGLQDIEFAEGKNEIRISSQFLPVAMMLDGAVEAAFRVLKAHCAENPSSAEEIEKRLEEMVSAMTKIIKEDRFRKAVK